MVKNVIDVLHLFNGIFIVTAAQIHAHQQNARPKFLVVWKRSRDAEHMKIHINGCQLSPVMTLVRGTVPVHGSLLQVQSQPWLVVYLQVESTFSRVQMIIS